MRSLLRKSSAVLGCVALLCLMQISAIAAPSATISITVMIEDAGPPDAPLNVSGVVNNQFIDLSWDANTENDLAGYNVYRQGGIKPGGYSADL